MKIKLILYFGILMILTANASMNGMQRETSGPTHQQLVEASIWQKNPQKVKALLNAGINPNLPIETPAWKDATILDILWDRLSQDYPMTRNLHQATIIIFQDLVKAGAKFRHRTGLGPLEGEIKTKLGISNIETLDQ